MRVVFSVKLINNATMGMERVMTDTQYIPEVGAKVVSNGIVTYVRNRECHYNKGELVMIKVIMKPIFLEFNSEYVTNSLHGDGWYPVSEEEDSDS